MGPIMMARMELGQRIHLRGLGYGGFKIRRMMDGFSSTVVHGALAEVEAVSPGATQAFESITASEEQLSSGKVGSIGDGSILSNLIAAIKTFMASDFGKALMAAIEKALLAFIGL